MAVGTVGYMCPETLRGGAADQRSDIFSFGATVYEMLSGNRAFRGDTAADVIGSILREEPPELIDPHRNIPPALERIVRHCSSMSHHCCQP
jgi:eukaryotic-like serine/threonine-protein kinase